MEPMQGMILALILILTGGCGDGSLEKVLFEDADKIVYRFEDASVPPRYHRSYTITLTKNTAMITVDSYGDILEKKSVPISRARFDEIMELIRKSNVDHCNKGDATGCTGGTGERLKLMDGDTLLFKGYVYHCGGKDYGDLCGNIDQVAREIRSLFPEFDRLVK